MKNFDSTLNVSGDDQQSDFGNATQQVIGDKSVSIALYLPRSEFEKPELSELEIERKLKSDLLELLNKGYKIKVEIGDN